VRVDRFLVIGLWVALLLCVLPANAAGTTDKSKTKAQKAQKEDDYAPVVFDARPADDELAPRNASEREAGVVVLSYSVEHKADISNWSVKGSTTERHRARYLVRDSNGVANLQKHTFFGDESDVVVADVQGQTISPDGSIHPIDPERDIRKLDIEQGNKADDIMRTVNFPRIEPGAILDLAWTSKRKQLPSIEVVDLESGYPIRDLSVKVRGRLIGQGKAFLLGSGQYYWVPFFASRVPDNTKVRMSSAFDLELSASGLDSYQHEPLSPPASRSSAWLAVVPLSFPIGNWKKHFHLFEDVDSLQEVSPGERVWFETSIGSDNALAEVDELGLQTLPLQHSEAQLKDFQATFRFIEQDYRNFIGRKKRGETPAILATIAPPELSIDERVDRIVDYVADSIELRSAPNPSGSLTKLLNRGYGSGFPLMYYTYYLLQKAELPVTMVWIADRTDQLIVPALNDKSMYGGRFFLEVDNGSSQRYLLPYREHTETYSLESEYLGSVLFRQGERKKPWTADRVSLDTQSTTGWKLTVTSPLVVDDETDAVTTFEPIGNSSSYFKQSYGNRTEQKLLDGEDLQLPSPIDAYAKRIEQIKKQPKNKKKAKQRRERLDAKVERDGLLLRTVLGSWLDTEIDEDVELTTPDYLNGTQRSGAEGLVWEQSLPWEPKTEDLGDSVLVPPIPMSSLFRNKLLDDTRTQPLWLVGGDKSLQMNWQVGTDFASPATDQVRNMQLSGPGGLSFELNQAWDEQARVFSTSVRLQTPFLLPASDYDAVKRFYVDMQRAVEKPVLLKRL